LPIVQSFVIVLAALILLVNFAVEILAGWIDPRLRQRRLIAGAGW
jgi:ABC-type dipeptide/oligopeptide/nickel transport system permease component